MLDVEFVVGVVESFSIAFLWLRGSLRCCLLVCLPSWDLHSLYPLLQFESRFDFFKIIK